MNKSFINDAWKDDDLFIKIGLFILVIICFVSLIKYTTANAYCLNKKTRGVHLIDNSHGKIVCKKTVGLEGFPLNEYYEWQKEYGVFQ